MKKTPPKLMLRKETLRALSATDLVRVIGGDSANIVPQSGDKQCPAPAAVVPG